MEARTAKSRRDDRRQNTRLGAKPNQKLPIDLVPLLAPAKRETAPWTASYIDGNARVGSILIGLPSGWRNNMARLPHGCCAGVCTQSLTCFFSRLYSASTSSTSKSRIAERLAAGSAPPAP